MPQLAALPIVEGLGAAAAGTAAEGAAGAATGGLARSALRFGVGSMMRGHFNRQQGHGDSGFTQYARENPGEAGLIIGAKAAKMMNTPGLGADAAAQYGSLSRSQFG